MQFAYIITIDTQIDEIIAMNPILTKAKICSCSYMYIDIFGDLEKIIYVLHSYDQK